MQEGDLRREDDTSTTTDDEDGSMTSPQGVTKFSAEGGALSGNSSSDQTDAGMLEMLKNSSSVSKLSSTEDASSSLTMLPGLSKGVASSSETATGQDVELSSGSSQLSERGATTEVAKLTQQLRVMAEDRKNQKETIMAQRSEIAALTEDAYKLKDVLQDVARAATQGGGPRGQESSMDVARRLDRAVRDLVAQNADSAGGSSAASRIKDLRLKEAQSELEAAREEIRALRTTVSKTADTLELGAQVDDERNKRIAVEAEKQQLVEQLAERDAEIASLQDQVRAVLESSARQTATIESQNAEIARLQGLGSQGTRTLTSEGMPNYEDAMRDLDVSLKQAYEDFPGQVTPPRQHSRSHSESQTGDESSSDLSKDDQIVLLRSNVASKDAELDSKDAELHKLREAMVKLEAGLSSIEGPPTRSAESYSSAGEDSDAVLKLRTEVDLLRQLNEDQRRTIELQKIGISALQEEVSLRTNQVEDYQDDNLVNVEKQRRIAGQLQDEMRHVAQQRRKLDRDVEQFRVHLRAFKAQRRAVLGGAVLAKVEGIPKERYRVARDKREKYKRKTLRGERELRRREKLLLQHVELVEVDNSQAGSESDESWSGSDTSHSSYTPSSSIQTSARSSTTGYASASTQSIQLVKDTSSSEAGGPQTSEDSN